MAYAIFRCCVTATHLPDFDASTDALLQALHIETVEISAFGCCGYPLKNIDMLASLAAAARNLALAEQEGVAILTACACCFGTLSHAVQLLKEEKLLAEVNERLAPEGLTYGGGVEVKHLFHILKDDVGLERLAKEATTAHHFRSVALQYGCKLQRPSSSVGSLAHEVEPLFTQLTAVAGATPVPWGLDKDCCGSGIQTTDLPIAAAIGQNKQDAAKAHDANGIVAACPFCQLSLQSAAKDDGVPVLSVAQLLCKALGVEKSA